MVNKKTNISNENLLEALKNMKTIRRFEEVCAKFYSQGEIAGFCHLYIGQEAVIVGTKMAMHSGDPIITGYRAHGHAIMSGVEPKAVLAELLGMQGGSSKVKGGSMHLYNKAEKFFGGNGIVGAQVPLGTGAAFADMYLGNKSVSYVMFGDGAANQGQVYESFNIAKLWNLPVVFIIENNMYAMGTSTARGCANHEKLYERGLGFNIPGKSIDGMNIEDVYLAAKNAREYALENGPILLEMQTYRYRGHSMSDPGKYRTKEEVNDYKDHHDCIDLLTQKIMQNGIISEKELQQIEEEIESTMDNIIKFATEAQLPSNDEIFSDIYA
jgi:pyruvate dehydrogenase E1 component alpha subunit